MPCLSACTGRRDELTPDNHERHVCLGGGQARMVYSRMQVLRRRGLAHARYALDPRGIRRLKLRRKSRKGHTRISASGVECAPCADPAPSLVSPRRTRCIASRRAKGSAMMGRNAQRFTPVLAVSLDELVPADHCSRHSGSGARSLIRARPGSGRLCLLWTAQRGSCGLLQDALVLGYP